MWYQDITYNWNTIDTHNHSSGKGVQIPASGIVTGAITNTQINAAAAIAGTKISPDFGSQDVKTSGSYTFDSSSGFRYSGSKIQYREGGGSWNDLTAVSSANAALSNLGITTINASLIPATDNTIDLGASTPKTWRKAYITEIASTTIGATIGNITTVASTTIGATTGNITTANITTANITTLSTACIPPVGSIIPFYDYNGALTFNSTYWAYCNGQTKTVYGIGSQVLPDLSNRYLVGFGTEGGTDNGSAAWSTTPVGNASHLVTLTGAQSGIQAHSIEVSGSISGTAGTVNLNHRHTFGGSPGGSGGSDGVKDVVAAAATFSVYTGYSDLSHSHSVNGSCSATGSVAAADASQAHSIQPRSIPVRFLMRIL